MKQRRFVSMIGALVVLLGAVAFITGCPQANSNKDKKDNTTVNNGGNNTGNTGGNNGSNTGGNNTGNTGGNNGSNTGGNTGGNTAPAKYAVYLKNNSTAGTITFWYVEESDNEDITYYGDTAIAPGEIGVIINIPGNKKYNLKALVKYEGSSEEVPKWIYGFYLDENTSFVLE